MNVLDKVVDDVKKLMKADDSGHGYDHVERVYKVAVHLAEIENADVETVALGALLHDCDDYKLFGEEAAANLTNAKKIMHDNKIDTQKQEIVLDIIANMGYSKSLKGIRPHSLEGKIVSDADMLDAIGILGVIRCLNFAIARCNKFGTPIFDVEVFPDLALTAEEYKKPNRKSDNFVNHFFEKLLKLRQMIFTKAAHQEAEIRHRAMVDFLYHFFREQNLPEWIEYLERYESKSCNCAS